jgi:hypothetical protein
MGYHRDPLVSRSRETTLPSQPSGVDGAAGTPKVQGTALPDNYLRRCDCCLSV